MIQQLFSQAFKASLPVMFGYIPLGIGFGILFATELDYHWIFAPLIGVFIYAGAAQYLLIGLLANHADLLEIFIAVLVLNSRHIVYGISLLSRYISTKFRKAYLVFALTDETYSLLSTRTEPPTTHNTFELLVSALNQSYWVLGCLIGVLIGDHLPFSTAGLEFALPALFMVLAIDQFIASQKGGLMLSALLLALVVLFSIGGEHMLIVSIVCSLTILLVYYQRISHG